jgi:hypothetical protein
MGGECSTYGEGCGVHCVLVGNPIRKMSIGRTSITWNDIIKTDLKR